MKLEKISTQINKKQKIKGVGNVLLILAIMFGSFAVSFVSFQAKEVAAAYTGSCSDTYAVFSYIYNNNKPIVNGPAGTASIFNSTNCTINVTLAAYKIYDQVLANQTLFATSPATLAPGETANLTVSLPNCMAQVDLFMGPAIVQLMESYPNNDYSRTFAFGFYQNQGTSYKDAAGPFCTTTNNSPGISITKTAPTTANVGNTITYGFQITNTGNVIQNNITFEDIYDRNRLSFMSVSDSACFHNTDRVTCNFSNLTAGQSKNFTINFTVSAGAACSTITNQANVRSSTITAQNSNIVNTTVPCQNTLSCNPSNQNANLYQQVSLYATNGNGSYNWSAPEANTSSVNGNMITVSYANTGTKLITVYSGGVSAICTVFISTGGTQNPNVVQSKSAWNDTKNVNAITTPASREDYITYTLTTRNTTGTEAQNYVVRDDLSGVLPLADLIDFGGGYLEGQTIVYPAINIPAYGSINKTFRVRIKYFLSTTISYQLINTYGNTVTIIVNPPPTYTPPRTGANTAPLMAIGLGIITVGWFTVYKNHRAIKLV